MANTSAVTSVVADVVDKHEADLIELRRDLHAHPELSWSETRTSELLAGRVAEAGWRVQEYGRTGFSAELGEGETTVALRADMDALPVQDLTDDPWSSTKTGVAHACGHDVHTTALLGAALGLAEAEARELLPGRVRLLFQPAEEVMPGGALHLMDSGALEGVERVMLQHLLHRDLDAVELIGRLS